jgi:hypothetical protein
VGVGEDFVDDCERVEQALSRAVLTLDYFQSRATSHSRSETTIPCVFHLDLSPLISLHSVSEKDNYEM